MSKSSKVILTQKVDGLPYKIGNIVPVYIGKDGECVWHVWKTIIKLPRGSYKEV